jgi:hypothetical protein
MLSRREIENMLYSEVERATERHEKAKSELITISRRFHLDPGFSGDDDDPLTWNAESSLRNAGLALLAAIQRYNAFVSRGVVPDKLTDRNVSASRSAEPRLAEISALAVK